MKTTRKDVYVEADKLPSPDHIVFREEMKTYYSIGGIEASLTSPATLFQSGESLKDGLDRIFSSIAQPIIVREPSISLSLGNYSLSGEYGASIGNISYNISTDNGEYSFNGDTGVTWGYEASVTNTFDNQVGTTDSGQFSFLSPKVYGSVDSITFTADKSHSEGSVALDNKGNESNPVVKIAADTKSAFATLSLTALYRQFYGEVSGSTVSEVLSNLKNITNSTSSLKTYLQNSNPTENITITTSSNGYIWFVTKHSIGGVKMGGLEFPITYMGSGTFTNQFDKTYTVDVYRSTNEQTAQTYVLNLE